MKRKKLTSGEKVAFIMRHPDYNKNRMVDELGVSRPTFNSRLKTGKYKPLEVKRINELYEYVLALEEDLDDTPEKTGIQSIYDNLM